MTVVVMLSFNSNVTVVMVVVGLSATQAVNDGTWNTYAANAEEGNDEENESNKTHSQISKGLLYAWALENVWIETMSACFILWIGSIAVQATSYGV